MTLGRVGLHGVPPHLDQDPRQGKCAGATAIMRAGAGACGVCPPQAASCIRPTPIACSQHHACMQGVVHAGIGTAIPWAKEAHTPTLSSALRPRGRRSATAQVFCRCTPTARLCACSCRCAQGQQVLRLRRRQHPQAGWQLRLLCRNQLLAVSVMASHLGRRGGGGDNHVSAAAVRTCHRALGTHLATFGPAVACLQAQHPTWSRPISPVGPLLSNSRGPA